jgi:hypothetical protein
MHNPLIASLVVFAVVGVPAVVRPHNTNFPAYRQHLIVGEDGKPSLQITNDSDSPIVAFVRVDFSSGLEGRTYYDCYINPDNLPIAPGGSLSLDRGSRLSHDRDQIRAVVLEDGTSVGDSAWINAIFATRIRLHDRLLSVHELLRQQVGTGISREGIIALLLRAQSDIDKKLPDDDLRVMDDVVFHGAISTFDANREANADQVLKVCLKSLEKRAAKLEHSQPELDTLRARLADRPDPSQPIIPPPRTH